MGTNRRVDPALAERLWQRARAGRWSLAPDAFAAVLEAAVARALPEESGGSLAVTKCLERLHLEDLALAAACAAGDEAAWEHFVAVHRPALYRAADAIDRTGRARELADALYADLFGLKARDGQRQSLLRHFHGRSSLITWLRAVLAQRHVDRLRETRRLVDLPEHAEPVDPAGDPDRPAEHARATAAVRAALMTAVAALEPRDRLRLSLYYVRNLTLAAIGRLTHEHEATVSRQLARTRRLVRTLMERDLRDRQGLDADAAAQSVRRVMDDPGTLNVGSMLGPSSAPEARKIVAVDRSES